MLCGCGEGVSKKAVRLPPLAPYEQLLFGSEVVDRYCSAATVDLRDR